MTNTESAERPDYEAAREDLAALMTALGLSFQFEFVPLSKVSKERREGWSHDRKPALFLTWKCRLMVNMGDRAASCILETDYSAGAAHCPAYSLSVVMAGGANSLMRAGTIAWECEHGHAAVPVDNASAGSGFSVRPIKPARPILPDPVDVFGSLLSDASALDHSTFEDWAGDYGYDVDSRKAEKIYRACLEIALKLRAALGDEALAKARDLAGRL